MYIYVEESDSSCLPGTFVSSKLPISKLFSKHKCTFQLNALKVRANFSPERRTTLGFFFIFIWQLLSLGLTLGGAPIARDSALVPPTLVFYDKSIPQSPTHRRCIHLNHRPRKLCDASEHQ